MSTEASIPCNESSSDMESNKVFNLFGITSIIDFSTFLIKDYSQSSGNKQIDVESSTHSNELKVKSSSDMESTKVFNSFEITSIDYSTVLIKDDFKSLSNGVETSVLNEDVMIKANSDVESSKVFSVVNRTLKL